MGVLAGKVCLVTGANRGIGLASSLLAARAGAHVVLSGRDAASLERAQQTIAAAVDGASTSCVVCDVADEASVKQAFQSVFKQHKRLDALVANAGVMEDALIGMVTRQQIERIYATNTFGLIHCAQYGSRLMARNGGGSIVALSSIIGTNGNVGQTVYSGSKAAVIGVVKSLAKELAPQNIRVNAVAPGFIDTDMAHTVPPEKFQERLASIKMNRIGRPEEVGHVIVFLMSELASYVTGQVVGVDGGMLI